MTSDRWARVGGGIKSGMLLGPYRLQDVVGEGGMGVVIVALDTKLQRPVAIKFLSTQVADAESRRRFQREAQLASSLNHPHILTVHDVGEFDGSQSSSQSSSTAARSRNGPPRSRGPGVRSSIC